MGGAEVFLVHRLSILDVIPSGGAVPEEEVEKTKGIENLVQKRRWLR